jgi:hypothetical protein
LSGEIVVAWFGLRERHRKKNRPSFWREKERSSTSLVSITSQDVSYDL